MAEEQTKKIAEIPFAAFMFWGELGIPWEIVRHQPKKAATNLAMKYF